MYSKFSITLLFLLSPFLLMAHVHSYSFFSTSVFDQMWLNEEIRISQVANINQVPGTDGFTSPPKDAVINTSSFFKVELRSTLIGEKKPDPSGA